jgi:hypothetical protein
MCNRASRLVDRLSLYSGAAGLKAWSVVSYFLRYFSSTSTEQISPDSAGPFNPVGFAIFATHASRGPSGCTNRQYRDQIASSTRCR